MNRWVFSLRRNVVIFPTDLTLTRNEFRVGAATEKAFVLTLGTKSKLELDYRSCLGNGNAYAKRSG